MYNINQEIITTDFFGRLSGPSPVIVRIKKIKITFTFIIESWAWGFFWFIYLFIFIRMPPKTVYGSSSHMELNYPLHLLVGWECD